MTIMQRETGSVNLAVLARAEAEGGPETWPSWTDDWRWVPTDEDVEWAAEEFGQGTDGYDLAELLIDEDAAAYAAFEDTFGRYLISPETAEHISRSSLVGHSEADMLIHRGSDPRYCGCVQCTLERTARFA